tara:strand:+ start:377 stop:583 length:207 start_codon:yes stop_codon:yes gene_type:complete
MLAAYAVDDALDGMGLVGYGDSEISRVSAGRGFRAARKLECRRSDAAFVYASGFDDGKRRASEYKAYP